MNTDLTKQRYPGLARAVLEMAYDNGGINRYRREADCLRELNEFLSDGPEVAFDLPRISAWLETLDKDTLETVVAGEQTDAEAICANGPPGTHELLDDIFNAGI